MQREPNTEYILSLSYGKDSIACLEAIKQLGYPLDRIVHAEVWATDEIPADLPPMIEFKKYADDVILDRYGIKVEHICAMRSRERERERESYENLFYSKFTSGRNSGRIYGFPYTVGAWCNDRLKTSALKAIGKEINIRGTLLSYSKSEESDFRERGFGQQAPTGFPCPNTPVVQFRTQTQSLTDFQYPSAGGIGVRDSNKEFSPSAITQGAKINTVHYLGIASDEPKRIEKHISKPGIILPLVDIGWNEDYCRQWCEENGLLSPIYTSSARGGCWFCHNQGVDQLRLLRKEYPELWQLLLKWDKDSPTTFKPNGHTVHDFDKRFEYEDKGLLVPGDKRFRWKKLDELEEEESKIENIKS